MHMHVTIFMLFIYFLVDSKNKHPVRVCTVHMYMIEYDTEL